MSTSPPARRVAVQMKEDPAQATLHVDRLREMLIDVNGTPSHPVRNMLSKSSVNLLYGSDAQSMRTVMNVAPMAKPSTSSKRIAPLHDDVADLARLLDRTEVISAPAFAEFVKHHQSVMYPLFGVCTAVSLPQLQPAMAR